MNHTPELARLFAETGQALLQPPPPANEEEGREYVRLFLSPQGALCPPWQSVWLGDAGVPRLLGPPHHMALGWFREFGFEPAIESEPADHAGLLLLFYAWLLDGGADSETLARFEADHLKWMGPFAESLNRHCQTERFRELAQVLSQLVSHG